MSAWSLRASLGPRERSANRVQKRGERSNPPGMAASSGDLEAVSSSLWTTKEALRQPWTVQERASQYTRHVPQNQHLCGSADTRSGYYPHYYPHFMLAAGGRRWTAVEGGRARALRSLAGALRIPPPSKLGLRPSPRGSSLRSLSCSAKLPSAPPSTGPALRWAFPWGLRYRRPVDKGSMVQRSRVPCTAPTARSWRGESRGSCRDKSVR